MPFHYTDKTLCDISHTHTLIRNCMTLATVIVHAGVSNQEARLNTHSVLMNNTTHCIQSDLIKYLGSTANKQLVPQVFNTIRQM